jgi:hypothetical protein
MGLGAGRGELFRDMESRVVMSDRKITTWFLAAVAFAGLIYVCFELTPSSYGIFLETLKATDAGPIFGSARGIRSDEWSVATPLIQVSIRNGFRRVNETSIYHEDLRNFAALPLKDWSLIFKPQVWGFFVLPPALAYAIYFAFYMCGFLAGYYLLFRWLGTPAWLSVAVTMLVYFSGFTQFWWTIYGPLLAWLPWVLLAVLRPMPWWRKSLLCAWVFPTFVFSQAYPILLITLMWGAVVLILAYRPAVLRSPGDMAAVAIGVAVLGVVFVLYFGEVITIMRNTVYPGHRIAPPGGTSKLAALSEILPFVSFRLGDYLNFDGENICEIGALGSFLPLLTLCVMRYRALRDHAVVRRSLIVLLSGFVAITLWEVAPVPAWIGHILVWDRGGSQRWLFTSGLLLTMAAMLIWSNQLISAHPLRIQIFVLLGPVASIFVKFAWLIHQGETKDLILLQCRRDVLLCGVAVVVGLAAWFIPAAYRLYPLLGVVVLMNVYVFGRFNPIQSAEPIFNVPETDLVHDMREKAATYPGGVLYDTQSFGATLNGLGFRSVAHVLMAPRLTFFRSYFPAMDAERFNQVFNRYAHIRLSLEPMPVSIQSDQIEVPREVFVPVRNVRRVVLGPAQAGVCAQPAEGAIEGVSSEGATLTINGWAPWRAETGEQGVRVLSARSLRPGVLSTVQRPEVAEALRDYGFVKSGFQLRISSADGKAIRPEEAALVAFGTLHGENRLSCCGCP